MAFMYLHLLIETRTIPDNVYNALRMSYTNLIPTALW